MTAPPGPEQARGAAPAHPRIDLASALALCAAAGIVDAVGFIRHGAFAANMTGNSVLMAVALAERDLARALDCGLMHVWFFAGVAVGRVAWTLGRRHAAVPLAVEAAVLIACALVTAERTLALGAMALAMGVQGAALSRFAGISLSTVVVTSTMVRLAEANTDLLLRWTGRAAGAERAPMLLLAGAWVAYAAGAASGVWLVPTSGVPILLAAALVVTVGVLRRRARH